MRNTILTVKPWKDVGHLWATQLAELFTLTDWEIPGYELPRVTVGFSPVAVLTLVRSFSVGRLLKPASKSPVFASLATSLSLEFSERRAHNSGKCRSGVRSQIQRLE